jgi:DNA invertase Pin-like site-specific DNA recombinase
MNKDSIVALYARVSSDKQAKDNTIDSQIAALKEKISADGGTLIDDMMFIDAGVSGATLVRPELERLRDSVAVGAIDQVYLLSPDRLARKYAHQALLMEEFSSAGVTVHFLNHAVGTTPEDELLLQMQGMIAEYERAKIIERHRRGKLHRAKSGSVNVLSGAPYGYTYIRKQLDGEPAQYIINLQQAKTVRQMFRWIGVERLSIGEVCRRLSEAEIPTQTGKAHWGRMWYGGCCKIQLTWVGRRSVKRKQVRSSLVFVRRSIVRRRRRNRIRPKEPIELPGSRSRCRHLLARSFSWPFNTSWMKTGSGLALGIGVPAIFCKDSPYAATVNTPTMARRSALQQRRGNINMRIIAALALMLIALVESVSVITSKYAPRGWMMWFGGRFWRQSKAPSA